MSVTRRRDVEAKAAAIQAGLRTEQLRPPTVVQGAYTSIVTSQTRLITLLNTAPEAWRHRL